MCLFAGSDLGQALCMARGRKAKRAELRRLFFIRAGKSYGTASALQGERLFQNRSTARSFQGLKGCLTPAQHGDLAEFSAFAGLRHPLSCKPSRGRTSSLFDYLCERNAVKAKSDLWEASGRLASSLITLGRRSFRRGLFFGGFREDADDEARIRTRALESQ